MEKDTFEVICDDGVQLKGILFIPKNPKAVVQLNCATGTKKEIYIAFLSYLADNNYLCCLWDYRGSGDSSADNLRNCNFTYSDYGQKDMPAIKNYLQGRYPHLPMFMIGHSTGGQQIGFIADITNIHGVINFAVSSGYYSNMPIKYRMKAYFFFYIFSPISVLINGYVKAKPYGFMENLPKKVVYEWRDWLEKEDYFFDEKFYGKTVPFGHFKTYPFPIHIYWTIDDTISNEKNTKAYWRNIHSEATITYTKLTPKDYQVSKIDHFGFFKKNMEERLWPDVLQRLDSWLQAS